MGGDEGDLHLGGGDAGLFDIKKQIIKDYLQLGIKKKRISGC